MRKILLLLMMIFPLATAGAEVVFSAEVPEGWEARLRVTVLETGRSDAILVESGAEAMLIDGGSGSWVKAVQHDLTKRGISQPAYFLSTHPHNDHIEGLTGLMERGLYPVRFLSAWAKDDDVNTYHAAAVKAAWDKGVIFRLIRNGDVLSLGESQLSIFRTAASGINGKCAVVMVSLGERRILLTADLTGDAQKALLKAEGAENLQADIIKAPHHGENAMVETFLTAIDPALILCTVSSGEASSLAGQAKARSLPLLYSGDGEIVLETDGLVWYVWQNEKAGPDRWKSE